MATTLECDSANPQHERCPRRVVDPAGWEHPCRCGCHATAIPSPLTCRVCKGPLRDEDRPFAPFCAGCYRTETGRLMVVRAQEHIEAELIDPAPFERAARAVNRHIRKLLEAP